ncbi:xylose isomerase [Bacillus sp. SA1-12]|uniref:sugar phosphate isomerase/epimerase family protein n=1 Tax=Bacillus sp. SA1-12 TaxID=1455638 RepID=UPI000626F8E6|nr:sugar phosphate isomerase/epimerase family protein [Bacillus sp. SA1-12]KKI90063.1 xylose isomerase [Bacillus sp. SA1-12]
MRFGCCTDINHSAIVKEAGFDFLECTVVSLVPDNDDDFERIFNTYKQSPLPIEACNIFLPGNLKIVGNEVNYGAVERYVDKALSRVKQIGARTVVFGSGRARSLPEAFSRVKGEEQIITFLDIVADYADPLGITVVIEPLNRKESNMINSIPEAMEIAKKVNRDSIQVLADFYHMHEEKEPIEHLVSAKDLLKHIHVADSGRFAPGTGTYPYKTFVHCLKEANYDGLVSIECNWKDFETEIYQTKQFLQNLFE